MKKTIALISAAALVLTLAGCNNTENNSTGSTGTNNSAPVSSAAQSVQGTGESADVPADPDSNPGEESNDIPADPDNSIVFVDDPDNPADPNGGEGGGADNSGLELPDNRAGRMVKAGLAVSEWGYLIALDAEMMTALIPGLNADDLEECCGVQPMMSAVANEVYCIKPKSGSMDTVKSALNGYVQTKKDDPMQYPSVQEVWERAVVEEDGGYVYLVCHPDSQTIADTMAAAQ